MKKLIRAMIGCVAAYYVIDYIGAVSMACAWGDLVKYGHAQAAYELDDMFHKKYCTRNRKAFDLTKESLLKEMKRK